MEIVIRNLKNYGVTVLCLIACWVFFSVPATANSDAARIRTDMTFEQVVSLIGEPDTVLNDEIRESIGETAFGDNLQTYYWQNDNPDCFPVAVSFSLSTKRVTGINEGRVCEEGLGQTSFAVPPGESCRGNQLCNL